MPDPRSPAPRLAGAERWGWALAVALALAWLAWVTRACVRGHFSSDECFHASAVQWIAAHHALPVELPQYYSGFQFYYQPLFHLVGALWLGAFGPSGLPWLPGVLAAGTLAILFSGWASGSRRSGAWAALAMLTLASFGQFSARFYTEGLVTLLFAAITGAWWRHAQAPGGARAWLLGALAGAATIAKFTGIAWPGLLLAELAWALARGRRDRARGAATALAIALAIALPYWLRNARLYGAPLYPAGAALDPALLALNRAAFSDPPLVLLRRVALDAGGALVPLLALGIAAARGDGRRDPRLVLALAALAMLLAGIAGPFAAPRHLDAFLVVLFASLAGAGERVLGARPRLRLAVLGAFALAVAIVLAARPDERRDGEPEPELWPAFAAIRANVPAGERVLSLWTYETAWYGGRPATWPVPWGQRARPVRLFLARDASTMLAAMDEERIGWLLVPTEADPGPWNSANYPAGFMARADTLLSRGALREAWSSDDLRLLARARR